MLNVGKIETKDLSRKDFDSWFAGMLLKYDNFELGKDTDIELLTATLQTISANTQEVLSMNWNKMHDEKGNCNEIGFSIFSAIKWTDTQLLRLVVDPSLATEILKKQATGSRRFDYPQEVQLKLEGTILGVDSIYNCALGCNSGLVGIYPYGCDACIGRNNPPSCVTSDSDKQKKPICNVQRNAIGSGGGLIRIVFEGNCY